MHTELSRKLEISTEPTFLSFFDFIAIKGKSTKRLKKEIA